MLRWCHQGPYYKKMYTCATIFTDNYSGVSNIYLYYSLSLKNTIAAKLNFEVCYR